VIGWSLFEPAKPKELFNDNYQESPHKLGGVSGDGRRIYYYDTSGNTLRYLAPERPPATCRPARSRRVRVRVGHLQPVGQCHLSPARRTPERPPSSRRRTEHGRQRTLRSGIAPNASGVSFVPFGSVWSLFPPFDVEVPEGVALVS